MAAAETDASAVAEKLGATTTRRKKGTDTNQLEAATATGRRQTDIVNNQLNAQQ